MLTRRTFAQAGLATIAAAAACNRGDHDNPQPDVKPTEDLMREHGLLARLMLVLEAGAPQLDDSNAARLAVANAARTMREFIEDYHEALEEQHLFPLFRAKDVHTELVDTLLVQHRAGRAQIDVLLSNLDDRSGARAAIDAFIRMYRPHAAREDTVLFVDLPLVTTGSQIAELGEKFEAEEQKRFGPRGFERMVGVVAEIERTLNLDDLSRFTPNQS